MGIAPHIARLRAFVGHELLLLPSSAVLPVDEAGRIPLAWHAGASDGWSTVAWFTRDGLQAIPLSRFARALLTATGYLPSPGG